MQADLWKKVEELFQAAMAQPPEKRAEFLDQACPGDSQLRAEVQSLLDAAPGADSFLEDPPVCVASSLKPGQKIGHFEIIGAVGRGGMGEVWKARDLRLKRDVAIKVLPADLVCDPDRIARFEREARTASALNHPNIVSVHEIGNDGGVSFIVSELVDGETLARVIERGPLPLRKLIEVSTQICEGLAAAHAAGVIHRDLKPGNIMVTRDGRVKILDFGLARRDRAPGVDSTTLEVSHPGVILGTPGYMSPEQVRGESADHRSDLFSLGAVLYEMASGKPAFRGDSSVEVMNSILKDEPPELPPASPPALDRIVRRCVEKQPDRRFQSAADLGFALGSLSGAPAAAVPPKTKRRSRWAVIGIAAAAATGAAFLWLARPLPPPRIIGMVQMTNDGRENGAPMLTDGARLLFNLTAKDPLQVSVKGGEPAPLALPTREDQLEDISWDRTEFLVSRLIDYDWKLERRELWALPVFAGSARRLGNLVATQTTFLGTGIGFPTPRRRGPTDREQSAIVWSPDGQQLVYPRGNELHLARSDGTEVRKLATFEGLPFFARWSPEGRSLRVSVSRTNDTAASLWEVSINDGRARPLLPGWNLSWYTCCGNWTADGRYFVFQSRSNIWAMRENIGFFERASREPVQLTTGPMAYYWPLPSSDGKRIFIAGFQPRNEFRRYDPQFRRFEFVLPGISGDFLEFSKDGKWVVYESVPGGSIFRAASDGSQRLQLTWPPLVAGFPHWSPDGKQIAFTTTSMDRPGRVYVVAADGTGLRQVTSGEGGKKDDLDLSMANYRIGRKRRGSNNVTEGNGQASFLKAIWNSPWTRFEMSLQNGPSEE